jgi:hypothetical protein
MAGSGKLAKITGPLTVAQVRGRAAKEIRAKKVLLKLGITEGGKRRLFHRGLATPMMQA